MLALSCLQAALLHCCSSDWYRTHKMGCSSSALQSSSPTCHTASAETSMSAWPARRCTASWASAADRPAWRAASWCAAASCDRLAGSSTSGSVSSQRSCRSSVAAAHTDRQAARGQAAGGAATTNGCKGGNPPQLNSSFVRPQQGAGSRCRAHPTRLLGKQRLLLGPLQRQLLQQQLQVDAGGRLLAPAHLLALTPKDGPAAAASGRVGSSGQHCQHSRLGTQNQSRLCGARATFEHLHSCSAAVLLNLAVLGVDGRHLTSTHHLFLVSQ